MEKRHGFKKARARSPAAHFGGSIHRLLICDRHFSRCRNGDRSPATSKQPTQSEFRLLSRWTRGRPRRPPQ
jgi:hypothetical protein